MDEEEVEVREVEGGEDSQGIRDQMLTSRLRIIMTHGTIINRNRVKVKGVEEEVEGKLTSRRDSLSRKKIKIWSVPMTISIDQTEVTMMVMTMIKRKDRTRGEEVEDSEEEVAEEVEEEVEDVLREVDPIIREIRLSKSKCSDLYNNL